MDVNLHNYSLVRISAASGDFCSIYTIKYIDDNGKSRSILEHFQNKCIAEHMVEYNEIVAQLKVMGNETGALEESFEFGQDRDRKICYLTDNRGVLRLYCIWYRETLILVGTGGEKGNIAVAARQDAPDADYGANKVIQISKQIDERIRNGEIWISKDGLFLEGNLNFLK